MNTLRPWWMLVIISLGFVELTLNWFDIASGFGVIGKDLGVGLPQLGLLVSLFLLGYGIFHIPTGFLATKWGLKNTMVAGLVIESLGGLVSGLCYTYPSLAFMRFVTGIGGSLFVGCGFAMTNVWFKEKHTALALGISGGTAFGLGAAIGLFPWVSVVQQLGWHMSLVTGGIVGLAIAVITQIFMKTPPDHDGLFGARITRESLRHTLGSRDLWMVGLGIMGGYGAYFTATQLLAEYVISAHHFSPSQAGALSAIMVLAGIPGSIIGGWWSDKAGRRIPFLIYPIWIMAVALLLTIVAQGLLIWIIAFAVGFLLIFSFSAWTAVPGGYATIRPEDLATAEGLMLTLAAVGGFLVPMGFGYIANFFGYEVGWVYLAVVSIAFSFLNFFVRDPAVQKLTSTSLIKGQKSTDS